MATCGWGHAHARLDASSRGSDPGPVPRDGAAPPPGVLGDIPADSPAPGDERMAQPDHLSLGRCASMRDDLMARHGARGPVTNAKDPAYRQMWQRPAIRSETICRVGGKSDATCAVATERVP
jgi:hypothetical protein